MINLSVIIPVFNAGLLIDRCLDSILNQTDNVNYEVICIDDGSTDNSVDIIRSRNDKRIHIIQQKNSGPSAARNRGIEIATGKYLAFLDADDYWLPGFIEETVRFLENNNECIAVSVMQEHITPTSHGIAPSGNFDEYDINGVQLNDFYEFWAKHNHVCTGSILIRTDIAKITGGMREDLRVCEDLEFWAYLASFGNLGFIPKVLFVSDGNKVTEQIGWVEKNKKRWESAVTIEEWSQRHDNADLSLNPNYLRSRGKVAQNLCYSILLSKRYNLAFSQVKKHGKEYPKNKISTLLNIGGKNTLFWWIISRLLVYREYHRK